jgi:hypothetical protein
MDAGSFAAAQQRSVLHAQHVSDLVYLPRLEGTLGRRLVHDICDETAVLALPAWRAGDGHAGHTAPMGTLAHRQISPALGEQISRWAPLSACAYVALRTDPGDPSPRRPFVSRGWCCMGSSKLASV